MVQALHWLTNGATNQYQSLACGTERDCLEGGSPAATHDAHPPRQCPSGGIRARTATSISPRRQLPEPSLQVTRAGSPCCDPIRIRSILTGRCDLSALARGHGAWAHL